MSKTGQIHLRITCQQDFRRSARDRALSDGLSQEEAARYLDDDEMSLGECAAMLFDPGLSPNGCQILDAVEAP